MRFLVLGAGKLGRAVIFDLCKFCPEAQIILVDSSRNRLNAMVQEFPDGRISVIKADLTDLDELSYLLSGADVVISCIANRYNYSLAKASIESGASFCDVGSNEDVVRKQFLLHELAVEKGLVVIPSCGMAPGLVTIMAAKIAEGLDSISELKLRAGGLPLEPRPPFNYAQSLPVEEMIHEYAEDATIIRDGKLIRITSLTEAEEIEFQAPFGKLEAFHTSGGISTLPESLGAKAKNIDFKTLRYPGHCEKMKLLKELGLMESTPLESLHSAIAPRTLLTQLLDQRFPKDEPDVVLIRVDVAGTKDGVAQKRRIEAIDYMDEENNLSAVIRTTAFPVSIVAQMIASEQIKGKGTLHLEQSIPVDAFFAEVKKRGITLSERD